MANIKIPMYILYYIDVANNKLVKDSVIYQTEIISSSDVLSATSGNLISFKVPKFDHAIDNVMFKPQPRWSTIMNNQTSGDRLYYIVSSNSYNSDEYLEDPIFTPTNRTDEEPVNAYSPLFSGYLTMITCNRDDDFIQFDFNGFDWVYKNKLFSPDRNKLTNVEDEDYFYANFSSNYDPGDTAIGKEENPTIVPVFTNIIPPTDNQMNTNIIEKESATILKLKREGLHHLAFSIRVKHNSTSMSTVHIRFYRDACETDLDEEKEANKVLLGSMSGELEANVTTSKMLTLDLTDGMMCDIPSIYQKWIREYSLDNKSNIRHFKFWVEVFSNSTVTYDYASSWASTACYSLDHDQNYNARWNAQVQLRLDEVLKVFLGMTPKAEMIAGRVPVDEWVIPGETDYFDDKIIVLDDVQARLSQISLNLYPQYNYNRWSVSIGDACDEIMKSQGIQPAWLTYLYSNGKICPDPGSGISRNIEIETDYTNTDAKYNIKENYANHFYTTFGGQNDKPNSHYHTANRTLTQYRNGDGSIYKDPVLLIKYNSYTGTDKNETMTDEDMWNAMGIFNQQKANEYILNKYTYIYYPSENLIPNCRIGDRIVSTPNSTFQIDRAITTIGRVCENGVIKWVYKMEGE